MKCRKCNKPLDPFGDDTLLELCWEHSPSNPNHPDNLENLYLKKELELFIDWFNHKYDEYYLETDLAREYLKTKK